MNITQAQVNFFVDEIKRQNDYINTQGEIPPSSPVLKQWHEWGNGDFYDFFQIAQYLNLNSKTQADCETLIQHIERFHPYGDNVVCPSVKTVKQLPHAVTHIHRDVTVKSVVFRTMMNIREQYCREILGFDFPNRNSSIGVLNPTPQETLFDY